MKIVAIIQARMGSTRLPGKVMKFLEDKTVLAHVIERLKQVNKLDLIVVATSVLSQDDVICHEALEYGASVYRGSETDVLSRYYDAASQLKADVVIRITADCPLLDPQLISDMLQEFLNQNSQNVQIDYLSNSFQRSYPRGLDCEIFTMDALNKTYHAADKDFQREHVTPYIYQNPDLFKIKNYVSEVDYSNQRWTLDTAEDLDLIENIYKELYPKNPFFSTQDVLNLLQQNPLLVEINKHIEQKEIISKETVNAITQ